MFTFITCAVLLFVAYFTYGKFVESKLGIDGNRPVPSATLADGVDYVAMPLWRVFLIQLLNIAGTGPVFGAIAGAMWGPAAFLWITFGNIFGGAVHDLLVGIMSIRSKGGSISELVGENLGDSMRKLMGVFSVILLLLVGVVFITSPADILANLTGINRWAIIAVIFVYYIIATIVPVDKLIGKLYPVFGAALIIMCLGIFGGMIINGQFFNIPELSFINPHIAGKSIFPYLFISIACGAISGFHATQTPMMARCIQTEKDSRKAFYGAMITEGYIALIWAAAAMTFFGGYQGLADAGAAPVVVNAISTGLMGTVGAVLAVLGVVALPITSGDTAFRALRLTVADFFNISQDNIAERFKIAIPAFICAFVLLFIDFNIIWRYFGWSNQTLATFALWTGAAWLKKHGKSPLVALLPAMFMTVVVTTYILVAPEGFGFLTIEPLGGVKNAELLGIVIGSLLSLSIAYLFNKNITKK